MRAIIILTLAMFCIKGSVAQTTKDVVRFEYKVKKLDAKAYELSIIATIAAPWHIYSQFTPADGPSLPTSIQFAKNPLVELVGKPTEKGQLITKHEEILDTDLKYYANKVEFVQRVRLKAPVKTNLNGTIGFMVCTDERCLSPETERFNLNLN
jgi:hypothetical protein